MIENDSVDFVFSWDSLVHAESDVIFSYLKQLSKKLKNGGFGFFHHSNLGAFNDLNTGSLRIENPHWRASSVSAELFYNYCFDVGLKCITQEIIPWGGSDLHDCFSLFMKSEVENIRRDAVDNPGFNIEMKQSKEIYCLYDQKIKTSETETGTISFAHNIKELTNINIVPIDTLLAIDFVNHKKPESDIVHVSRSRPISLIGWAVNKQSWTTPETVYFQLISEDKTEVFYAPAVRYKRPDIAKNLRNNHLENAGIAVRANIEDLPNGIFELNVLQVENKVPMLSINKLLRLKIES